MRNIFDVIGQVKKLIPNNRHEFILALDAVEKGARYRAPEVMYLSWDEFSNCLKEHIPSPTQSWEVKVLSVFSTIPVEDIISSLETKK